jgi:hypothetical protein
MRDLQVRSRSRPFLPLSSRALGIEALGAYGKRRCGPLAHRAFDVCLPPFPRFRSSVPVKAAWLERTGSHGVPIPGSAGLR